MPEPIPLSLPHQKDPLTGWDRRDDAGGPGVTQGIASPRVNPSTNPSRSAAPIPDSGPPVLVRKTQ